MKLSDKLRGMVGDSEVDSEQMAALADEAEGMELALTAMGDVMAGCIVRAKREAYEHAARFAETAHSASEVAHRMSQEAELYK